jgi:uncharacterized membrane protein SpoIIM required for sporulation/ABC-type transport system involved in multi-copper enzyme maturation permease subunit
VVAVTKRMRVARSEALRMVLTLVRREVWDAMRDWRIVVPVVILTLLFPVLMSFVANMALNWVAKYGAPVVGERLLPFMLMIVGFFPISFSLVIALETFVGEKERKSLEPLLATPLTDAQLYVGKTLAAMIPPLLAGYLGIIVYLIGLYFFKGWTPAPILVVLIVLLTTAEGLVMVSGAVVVSSQTTSARAANLLASFIIIPMALLIQGEAVIMFWANYNVLWWIVLFLVVADVVLVRMGIHTFNREDLLGREIDELNFVSLWHTFYRHLRWERWFFGLDVKKMPAWLRWLGTLGGLYGREIPAALRRSRLALAVVLVGLLLAAYIGWDFAARYPFPSEVFREETISTESFAQSQGLWFFPLTTWGVLEHNVRVLVGAALLAVFSFGTLAVALLMAPLAVMFFLIVQAGRLGYDPLLFFAAAVLPHGVLELPAAVAATALAVRLGAVFMSPPRGMTVSEGWLWALADFVKVFLAFVLPLLALAAAVEAHVTPLVVVWVFGG